MKNSRLAVLGSAIVLAATLTGKKIAYIDEPQVTPMLTVDKTNPNFRTTEYIKTASTAEPFSIEPIAEQITDVETSTRSQIPNALEKACDEFLSAPDRANGAIFDAFKQIQLASEVDQYDPKTISDKCNALESNVRYILGKGAKNDVRVASLVNDMIVSECATKAEEEYNRQSAAILAKEGESMKKCSKLPPKETTETENCKDDKWRKCVIKQCGAIDSTTFNDCFRDDTKRKKCNDQRDATNRGSSDFLFE